jgi:hypothetical protein
VSDTELQRGSIVIDEDAYAGIEPPVQPKKLMRKKTPPARHYRSDTSDSADIPAVPTISPRLKAKKFTRPMDLPLQDQTRDNSQLLQVVTDLDSALTPKAASFEENVLGTTPIRRRKLSSARQRKMSSESRETIRRNSRARDSAGEQGDDEAYDDFLSAYESEEGTENKAEDHGIRLVPKADS